MDRGQAVIKKLNTLLEELQELKEPDDAMGIVLLVSVVSIDAKHRHRKLFREIKSRLLSEIDIRMVDDWPEILDGL